MGSPLLHDTSLTGIHQRPVSAAVIAWSVAVTITDLRESTSAGTLVDGDANDRPEVDEETTDNMSGWVRCKPFDESARCLRAVRYRQVGARWRRSVLSFCTEPPHRGGLGAGGCGFRDDSSPEPSMRTHTHTHTHTHRTRTDVRRPHARRWRPGVVTSVAGYLGSSGRFTSRCRRG
jgi:hypothetical protein